MEDTVHLKIKVLHRYFNTYKDCKRHLQACTDIHQKTYLGTQTGIRRHIQVHRQASEDIPRYTDKHQKTSTSLHRQTSEEIPRYTDKYQKTYLGTQTGIRRHTYYRGTGLQMDGTSSTMSGIQITLNDIAKSFQTFFVQVHFLIFQKNRKKFLYESAVV